MNRKIKKFFSLLTALTLNIGLSACATTPKVEQAPVETSIDQKSTKD